MMISVINQKGGVGKSTLAVHLAVWCHERGKRVGFIDADGQASAARWLRAVEPTVQIATGTDARTVLAEIRELRQHTDILIADGPANLSECSRALLLETNLAVIPCGGTLPELESTADTVRLLSAARKARKGSSPGGCVVLTRLRSDRYLLSKDARRAAESFELPVCTTVIKLREATADAPGQRTVVWRMGTRAREAAQEMLALIEELHRHATRTKKHAR